MELTEKQIQENWDKFIDFIKENFSGDRQKKLLKLYNDFGERVVIAPASAKEHFHCAFPGGYIVHIMNVVTIARKLYDFWKESGHIPNYELEELLFAALNHDLGKLGDIEEDYYVVNTSEWHRKNQGMIYDFNKNITFMEVPHRSIFLLQHYGITMSQQEFLGILLHDGLYDEGNKTYYIQYKPENQLKTNIPIMLHQADLIATKIEYEQWKRENTTELPKKDKGTVKKIDKKEAAKVFDELFK